MVILILINVVLIVYVYLKYYKVPEDAKDKNNEIENKDSIIIGYVNDRGFVNNFDLLISEIIELNIKGYIEIDYNKEGIDKYNYIIRQKIGLEFNELNNYEIHVLNYLFFKKQEITRKELEDKLKNTFKSYNIQYNDLKKIINKEVVFQGIVDEEAQKKHLKNAKKYVKISVLIVIIVIILGLFKVLDTSLLYMAMYILEKIILSSLLLNVNMYTKYGQILKYNIENYRLELEKKEFLINNIEMKEILLNKDFANSIALHIKTNAKEAFIDEKAFKEAKDTSKNAVMNVMIIASILALLGIIIYKIMEFFPIEGLGWIFIIFAIIAAGVFDVAHSLGRKK